MLGKTKSSTFPAKAAAKSRRAKVAKEFDSDLSMGEITGEDIIKAPKNNLVKLRLPSIDYSRFGKHKLVVKALFSAILIETLDNAARGKYGFYVGVPSVTLGSYDPKYAKVIKSLEQQGYIEVNNRYSNDPEKSFCKSYRFTRNFFEAHCRSSYWVTIKRKPSKFPVAKLYNNGEEIDIKNITDEKLAEIKELRDWGHLQGKCMGRFLNRDELKHLIWMMEWKFDFAAARREAKKMFIAGGFKHNKYGEKVNEQNSYYHLLNSLNKLERGEFFCKQSIKCLRIFHNMNMLRGDFKKFFYKEVDGKREYAIQVDIKASHPYIISNYVDYEGYKEIKDKYSILMDYYNIPRGKAKKIFLYGLNGHYIYKKQLNKVLNNRLTINRVLLIESRIMNSLTINSFDSFICDKTELNYLISLLLSSLKSKVGYYPYLEIDIGLGEKEEIQRIITRLPEEKLERLHIED